MNLYVLRHAIALDRTDWKGADAERPLTKGGIRKMKDVAKTLKKMDLRIDWILTSPYRRAYDTAVIAAKALHLEKRLKISKLLQPEGDPKPLVKRLALDYRSWEAVLLVGHEPYLSGLISTLIGGGALEMKKAGLAKLSAASLTYASCATLEWLLPPKLLRY